MEERGCYIRVGTISVNTGNNLASELKEERYHMS
jgi:hypothetical protein